jgi:cytochrome c oxidase subunit II
VSLVTTLLSRLAESAFAGAVPVHPTPSIFSPASTPADAIHHLSLFVLTICGAIFLVVSGLLLHSAVKFRRASDDDNRSRRRSTAATRWSLPGR